VVIASSRFAEEYAGPAREERALEKLMREGPRLVAITDGARGVVGAARGAAGVFRVPAFRVEAVDTTGAGDAFHAGAAWGLLEGHGWEESLRRGAAVAALKCLRAGAREGLPARAAVEAFLAG
jgi:sulfofructose kinase